MNQTLDINADLGEGGDFDRELLALVSSANISCGAHAGTEQQIRQAILWALDNDVAIGAHPSYPDKEDWGRRSMSISPSDLYKSLTTQIEWLNGLVEEAGGRLHHVKPHGALYNDAARDSQLAELFAVCVKDFDPSLTLVGLAGGKMLEAGTAAGLSVSAEAFVDRRYRADGSLVPRSHERAVITDVEEALSQALNLIRRDPVTTIDGGKVCIRADTLCIHGDSALALEFARALTALLSAQGVTTQSRCSKNLA